MEVQILRGMGQFLGMFARPIEKALRAFVAVYAKTTEPIEMPFGG